MKRLLLKKLRLLAKTSPTAGKAIEVYTWASHLTAEMRFGDFITKEQVKEEYYLTTSVRRLLFKLRNIEQGIIGVVGLQGVGKTATLQVLATMLHSKQNPALFVHWTTDWFKKLKETPDVIEIYRDSVYFHARERVETLGRSHVKVLGKDVTYPMLSDIEQRIAPIEKVELYLGKTECKKLKEEAVYTCLSNARFLFIDLPDYSKKNRTQMNKDLKLVETIWKKLQGNEYETWQIFVLGIQKEMFGGHFFFGKMDIVELEPLKSTELVEAYKKKWETSEPFTDDALLLIAEYSRGVFRRFLKYIQVCIERTVTEQKEFPITVSLVKETVTLDKLVKDMELELSDIFKQKEKKLQAVKLLNFLRLVKQANQKLIAKELDINEMAVSRLVSKLEAHNYITRTRGRQKEWLIHLTA